MHMGAIMHVHMCGYTEKKVSDTSCDYQILQSLFHSSSNTLLGNLPLSNENNIRASFICVLLKLFIYRAVSFCKSLCNLTDRFAGVVTWLGVQELQCDVIVRSGFQKQQHEGTLTFAV